MARKRQVVIKRQIGAPHTEVSRYFTNSTLLRQWIADVALATPRPGGRIYLAWNDGHHTAGHFTVIEPDEVAFTWQGEDEPTTRVEVSLGAAGEDVTDVEVVHRGFPKKSRKWRKTVRNRWKASLENLGSVLETGLDLRFTRRPMLGIMMAGEVTPERAAAEGLTIDRGVSISGTVPEMGAAAAGLQGGDILTSMGGTEIDGFASLGVALSGMNAGDEVEVRFVRDGRRRDASMTLSGRPIPDVPTTADGLATLVRNLHAEVAKELDDCFQGVSEEVANHVPTPGEWSAKQVLAHLLDGEGDGHSYLLDQVMGVDRIMDGPYYNSDLRTTVTADSYPDVASMLASLHHLEAQTAALIAGLPDEFVARKGEFWRLAYGWTQARPHYDEHLEQMRSAIETAR